VVHITQLLCPSRHCFAAVAWDDRETSKDHIGYELALVVAGITGPGAAAVCALCGSRDLHAEDGVTRWHTLDEARPHLEACERDQQLTRAVLTRPADRN
jgi:hypothetical protein